MSTNAAFALVDVVLGVVILAMVLAAVDYRARTDRRLNYLKSCVDDLARIVDNRPAPPPKPPAWHNLSSPHPWDE